jgi:flagellar basal-body rod modification protein FlgD
MAITPVSATSSSAQSAYGLDFQSLLRIILTQLTYQDPLKPVDNFQFVSQLAQFSQLQQSQTLNDQVTSLLAAQSANQSVSMLGRTIDFSTGTSVLSGVVQSVSFAAEQPEVTVKTSNGELIANISIAEITQVR